MNKKTFRLIQHTLIPLALIAANTALAHLIYLLEIGAYNYLLILTLNALMFLSAGIFRANKYLLLSSIVLYTLLLIFSIVIA